MRAQSYTCLGAYFTVGMCTPELVLLEIKLLAVDLTICIMLLSGSRTLRCGEMSFYSTLVKNILQGNTHIVCSV